MQMTWERQTTSEKKSKVEGLHQPILRLTENYGNQLCGNGGRKDIKITRAEKIFKKIGPLIYI